MENFLGNPAWAPEFPCALARKRAGMKARVTTKKPSKGVRVCSFCKFVREYLKRDTLGVVDETKYLRHLRMMHGFEP